MATRKPIVEVQVPVEELNPGDPVFFNHDKQVLLRRTPLPAGGYLLTFQGHPLVRLVPPGSFHTVALVRA
jgi:hypothetical protein